MSQAALLGGSLAAILLLALTAYALKLGGARLTTAAEACAIAEASSADFDAARAWLDREGAGAVVAGEDGSLVLVRRHGARFVARRLARPVRVVIDGAILTIASGEPRLGPFVLQPETEEEARLLTVLLGSRDG